MGLRAEISGRRTGKKWGSEYVKRMDKSLTHPISKHVNVDIYIPIM